MTKFPAENRYATRARGRERTVVTHPTCRTRGTFAQRHRNVVTRAAAGLAAVLLGACSSSCTRRERAREKPLAPIAVDRQPLRAGRPRLLLDEGALTNLRANAKRGSPAWKRVRAMCEEDVEKAIPSGYQSSDWGEAVADLSLCWQATGEARFAEFGTRYIAALLDDAHEVGDKKGGAEIAHVDHGYGIRNFGVYTALGYDWLHDAPSMTPELRARVADRLSAWLTWYGREGYLRDEPLANYFVGYATAATFAGLALEGDTPAASEWLTLARDNLLGRLYLPALETKLRGGDWPEGWQYGELSAAETALIAEAMRTATGVELARKMPWLGEVVAHHVHALLPGDHSVYDGGSWGDHPAKPSPLALTAVTLALDGIGDARAAEARWMTRHALPKFGREWAWIALLGEREGAPERDPHAAAPLSYSASGSGLSFFRSAWGPDATWASFQAGPRLAPDHQHNDAGHFELWRGRDGLLIDAGDYEGDATINHNALLINDGGRALNYAPNQGVWGFRVRTTGYFDGGDYAVAIGDIADAYSPKCAREGCSKRAVQSAIRTFLFVRPSLVVIDDRLLLEEEHDGATWAAHFAAEPVIAGSRATAKVGASAVDVTTLEPARAPTVALREPTPTPDDVYRKNHTWGPTFRLEVTSPTGAKERRFLHWIVARDATAANADPHLLSGKGLRGGTGGMAGKTYAVAFADAPSGGDVSLGAGAETAIVAGLSPGGRYTMRLDVGGCSLHVEANEHGDKTASAAGTLALTPARCSSP